MRVRMQRGFTLVELIVAIGIVALLSICLIALSPGRHPGALRGATEGFDSALAAARAIAATSGNGATLVVAPRKDANGERLPGFVLTVYGGRPTGATAVTPTTVMPLIADADVREDALGAPPFAIFLSSAGHASGLASYPSFDANARPRFNVVARQPECPKGGLVLTFTSARASQTRTLPCRSIALGPPQPVVTAPPSPIVLTPKSLTFFWPSAPQQHFVSTEWGYTRWYAGGSFVCGDGAAAFPAEAPAPPYTAAHSPQDASADPQPPPNVPYSFANAPDSMEDAPAWFYVSPQAAGICNATITDAHGETATMPVDVMGWLTLSFGGTNATALTAPLSIDADLSNAGDTAVIAASKTFDGEALAPNATLDAACSSYVRAVGAQGSATGSGSSAIAKAAIVLVSVQRYSAQSPQQCRGTVSDQYGEPSAALTFTLRTNSTSSCSQVGQTCTFGQPTSDDIVCEPDGSSVGGSRRSFGATLRPASQTYGTLASDGEGEYAFTRTALGPVAIDTIVTVTMPTYHVNIRGVGACGFHSTFTRGVITF